MAWSCPPTSCLDSFQRNSGLSVSSILPNSTHLFQGVLQQRTMIVLRPILFRCISFWIYYCHNLRIQMSLCLCLLPTNVHVSLKDGSNIHMIASCFISTQRSKRNNDLVQNAIILISCRFKMPQTVCKLQNEYVPIKLKSNSI